MDKIFITDPSDGAIPINQRTPTEFTTPHFAGRIRVLVSGCDGPDQQWAAEYFQGRRRRSQILIQGQFSHATVASEVLTGQTFEQPFKNLPSQTLVRLAVSLVRTLSPKLGIDLVGHSPFIVAPLVHACQGLRCDDPGSEPILHDVVDLEEHSVPLTAQIGSADSKCTSMSAKERRAWAAAADLSKVVFETNLVYTFEMYQHLLDLNTFSLVFPFWPRPVSLLPYLNGQPIQIFTGLGLGLGCELWKFEIHHQEQQHSFESGTAGEDYFGDT